MTCSQRVAAFLGVGVTSVRTLSGGDLSRVSAVTLADGRSVISKEAATAGAEAAMLDAIRAAGCPAPLVLAKAHDFLIMERLPGGSPPDDAGWAGAGKAIARLHATTGPDYGWTADHGFGTVAIPNAPAADWPGFWADRRLMAAPDALPSAIAARIETLAGRLAELLPERPAPALLHGDLWSGNLMFGADGFSGLIDPAACYGDAEVDLAMLSLFGRPPRTFFDAYGPLDAGWQDRRPVYQLWPALVHLRLFGAGYRPMVERLLDAVGA